MQSNNTNVQIYQRCTRCIMDTSAMEITFDESGVCNFCSEFIEKSGNLIYEDEVRKNARLELLVKLVKEQGRNKPYDCIVGVSGGVDSSWSLVQAKRLGLRPLAVHMDNGWNSELAQNNISNLVRGLSVDLYTHVINWEEYRALMLAFFEADVIDVELLYDNAMLAVCYQQARKFGVKYILSGSNLATEGMRMPKDWNWYKRDVRNITTLAKNFGNVHIKSFPTHSTLDFILDTVIRGVHWVSFLDYLPYNKSKVLDVLEDEYNFKRYPFKHYESIFTRFYQGYLLPQKFGVDKRLIHFSTLIISGQMTRDDAIVALADIPYSSQMDLENDKRYFLKKMGWSEENLSSYLERPGIPHDRYASERSFHEFLVALIGPNLKKRLREIKL